MFNKRKLLYKTIIILSIIGFLTLPNFSSATEQIPQIETPETFEEAEEMGKGFLKETKERLPRILEKIWEEEVIPVWKKMYEKWRNWWNSYIYPWLQNVWQKILKLLGREIEERKPIIEEQFEKEKEELKQELKEEIKKEAPEVGKTLWEKFKELIK